ncbi:MAG: hypothetical protein ACI94N_000722 [Candidatus Arcticimaribacter sp.]
MQEWKKVLSRGLKREGQTQPLKHYTKAANALNIELKVLFETLQNSHLQLLFF